VGGDVVRAWYLDGKPGRRTDAFVSVIADRVSGVMILLGIGLIALVFSPLDLPAWLTWIVAAMTGGTLIGLALVFVVSRSRFADAALKSDGEQVPHPAGGSRGLWTSHFGRLQSAVSRLQRALFPSWRQFARTTLLSIVVQLANVLVVWLCATALGISAHASYYLILVPTVTLLTLLPISLNGMGVREWGTVVFLTPLGVESSASLTLAFLWFAAFSVPSLAGVFFYLCCRVPRFSAGETEITGQAPGKEAELPSAA